MGVTEIPKDNVQFPSEDHSAGPLSQKIKSEDVASLTQKNLRSDSLAVSDQKGGPSFKTDSPNSDTPNIPPADENLIVTNKKEAEAEANPYFSKGSTMTEFWILMQNEIIPLMAELRALEKDFSIKSRQASYEASIDVAALKEKLKMKEASQEFVRATQSVVEATNSFVEAARMVNNDVAAQSKYNEELGKDKSALDLADKNFEDFKEAQGRLANKLPKKGNPESRQVQKSLRQIQKYLGVTV